MGGMAYHIAFADTQRDYEKKVTRDYTGAFSDVDMGTRGSESPH